MSQGESTINASRRRHHRHHHRHTRATGIGVATVVEGANPTPAYETKPAYETNRYVIDVSFPSAGEAEAAAKGIGTIFPCEINAQIMRFFLDAAESMEAGLRAWILAKYPHAKAGVLRIAS